MKPNSIKPYRQSERKRDVMLELFALWQRDFPDGIGIDNTVEIKENIVWRDNLEKIGYTKFFRIIIEIEEKYKKMEESKKCKL